MSGARSPGDGASYRGRIAGTAWPHRLSLLAGAAVVSIVGCGGGDERIACEPRSGAYLVAAIDPSAPFGFDDDDVDIFSLSLGGAERRRLTTAEGADFSPAFSPDGAMVAFRSTRDGNHEIYVMCADGSGERRLTDTAGEERSPAFSPDGEWIAFAAFTRFGIPRGIELMRPDGSERHTLTRAGGCGPEYPTWSPDGSRVAFHCFPSSENIELYVIGADGSGLRRVTRSPGEDSFPDWSPSGDRIAFSSRRGGPADIWAIQPDGSAPRPITRDAAIDSEPAYSPDGARIAYTSTRGRSGFIDQGLWIMRADGRGRRELATPPGSVLQIDWRREPRG